MDDTLSSIGLVPFDWDKIREVNGKEFKTTTGITFKAKVTAKYFTATRKDAKIFQGRTVRLTPAQVREIVNRSPTTLRGMIGELARLKIRLSMTSYLFAVLSEIGMLIKIRAAIPLGKSVSGRDRRVNKPMPRSVERSPSGYAHRRSKGVISR